MDLGPAEEVIEIPEPAKTPDRVPREAPAEQPVPA